MSATQTTMDRLLPLAKELDESTVTPGVLGFIVFAVMALGVWMLMKSMTRHMKRVDFEEAPAAPRTPGTRTAGTRTPEPHAPEPRKEA